MAHEPAPPGSPPTRLVERRLPWTARGVARVEPVLLAIVRIVTIPVRAVVRWWRRSIQARVVIGILTLSAILAVMAGWILLRQVTDGLVESKRQAGVTQAAAGIDTAQSQLDASSASGFFAVDDALSSLIQVLGPRSDGDDYAVVVLGPLSRVNAAQPSTWAPKSAGRVDPRKSVPADLVRAVQTSRDNLYKFTSVTLSGPHGTTEPGLVVGQQITAPTTGQAFGLFYVFPMNEQQQTLSVVARALFLVGSILVVLIGVIAWLVTRQVVTPVRLARRIAERLAAGRLEERMHVRGEDDIARLGTSFNQMASSLQRQIRQLEELSRVQRRFVSDVSHELRTPLTTVRMAADVLHDARVSFDPATARSAELLQYELDRFEGLLTDLLEISRFDAGAAALDLTDIDLRDVARRVVDSNAALAEQRGSKISLRLPTRPCMAEADVRRIERIVRNLVVNAIDYGEGGGIEVRVGAGGGAVALSVRDHGVGLKPGEERLVFNRFWRADPARVRTKGGTGLGLAIAAEDTALHGGLLQAWGRPLEGAVFRLTLPRRAGQTVTGSPLPLAPDVPAVGAPYATLGNALDRSEGVR
ncbi:MAG: MtrAB system histidine kinase MtrB [Nocardioidaceae bacterium]